jgi:hypothetical protein
MHLHQLMGWTGPMTERQFEGWNDWLSRQWNEPDRSDYYLMQVAAFNAAKPTSPDELRLKFTTRSVSAVGGQSSEWVGPRTLEEANAWACTKWMAAIGATCATDSTPVKNE